MAGTDIRSGVDIDFVTMGMLIIDEIHLPGQAPMLNVLGGAGTYAAVGARIFTPHPASGTIGWVVDAGSDFPESIRETIESLHTTCLIRESASRLTTRGWNGFGINQERSFRYTTPKMRITHTDLPEQFLRSKSFHLICSPTRCVSLVKDITARRGGLGNTKDGRPLWVWEPVPDLCQPEQLQSCLEALKLVDIVSPNHLEICRFFDKTPYDDHNELEFQVIEQCSTSFLTSGIGPDSMGSVIIRAGSEGCLVATRDRKEWIPAYHRSDRYVIDPTGAGNAFLGALAVGLVRDKRPASFDRYVTAAIKGAVAASFTVEQTGIPRCSGSGTGELWNGESAQLRLLKLTKRLQS